MTGERCDAWHDGHRCDGGRACRRALLDMCERMADRFRSGDPLEGERQRNREGAAGR